MKSFLQKQLLFLFLLAFILSKSNSILAQNRSELLPELAPFYHGVASGDPTANSVIIWTRITTTAPSASITWRVATDANMINIVKTGTLVTDASKDFTVKVDVTGLTQNTTYFYEFEGENKFSLRGRTKTVPTGVVDNVRFALVSCSNYAEGYYNAYKAIKDRNDIDAVLHLGDYIYEYGNGEYGNLFNLQPPTEMITLADYRLRLNYNKLDSNLLRLHQQYPFITIWDDHESADNAYQNGAGNHTEGAEGTWINRKAFSIKAYREWMPIRDEADPTSEIIYRGFQYGNLADVSFLDTRIIGRDEQLAINTIGDLQDQTRNLIGTQQLNWFRNRMNNATAQWKVIAQQVMVAPLRVGAVPINMDQWDGYEGERKRVYDIIAPKDNVVVLTGDIHTSWANELPAATYIPSTIATPCLNSLGVEFVVTSVTSPGLDQLAQAGPAVIMAGNPHMKYIELANHGYGLLDLTPTRAQHEWYFVNTITSPVFTTSFAKAFAVAANQKCLEEVTTPSIPAAGKITPQAPNSPRSAVVLPVRFIDFNGTLLQNKVALQWGANATDCLNYVVQKSTDGFTFTNIATVPCNATQQYNFIDAAASVGTSFYKIKMVGNNNFIAYSNTIKIINDNELDATANWYPNPTVKIATCEILSPTKAIATLKIINAQGITIIEKRVNVNQGLNYLQTECSALSNGLYVYEVVIDGVSKKLHGAFIKL